MLAACHPAARPAAPPLSQVLGQVYVSERNLDDDLVRSISLPAQDPNAAEVFYRVITGAAHCAVNLCCEPGL